MAKKNIIFIDGIADDHLIAVTKIHKNGSFDYVNFGSCNLKNHLKNDQFEIVNITFDTTKEQALPQLMIHGVFNEISDPDANKITLEKLENLRRSAPPQIPFFNLPSDIMKTTRDNIYTLLQGIDKLHVPRTVRIQPNSPAEIYDTIKKEGFEYPVIFRQAGDHGGKSTIRVDDDSEQFYAYALDGRDYYLTQFVDFGNAGLYKKYRLVVVDGEVYIRHVIFSDKWIIHSKSREYMKSHKAYAQEEKNILKSFSRDIKPHIQPVIDAIYQKIGLDYFGIDCTIDETFNITVFEINASMNILINTTDSKNNPWGRQIDMIKKALIDMITKEAV